MARIGVSVAFSEDTFELILDLNDTKNYKRINPEFKVQYSLKKRVM